VRAKASHQLQIAWRSRANDTLRSAASRGRTFVFRAGIRRAPGFPHETGVTHSVRVRVR